MNRSQENQLCMTNEKCSLKKKKSIIDMAGKEK